MSAPRQRRYRARQRHQILVCPIEVMPVLVAMLVESGQLAAADVYNRPAIGRAVLDLACTLAREFLTTRNAAAAEDLLHWERLEGGAHGRTDSRESAARLLVQREKRAVSAAAGDADAALLALKAERDAYVEWWQEDARTNDYDDDESNRRGDHLTAIERAIMRTPAMTVRGVAAKLDLLCEYTACHDSTLYSGVDDDGTEQRLDSHCSDSLWADLRRLTAGTEA